MRPAGQVGLVRIGVSSCLLGQNVRYDGGHKRDAFLTGTLDRFVEWVPVCPEVEMGLGTPRETLRLERRGHEVRLIMRHSGDDHTEAMRRFAQARVRALARADLSGYVLKKDSPSCGLTRVKVHTDGGIPSRSGRGLFAAELARQLPNLPVEEEGRLTDARLRENFLERVFAYRRLTAFFAGRWTLGGLVAFHSAHKLLLMAHSPRAYAGLGRLVATAKSRARSELRNEYQDQFMAGLREIATPRRHANVLQHMCGYVSPDLSAEERQELLGLIDDHRRGLLPLAVPVALLRHHVRRLRVTYLQGQVYLDPHPKELALRNHT